MAGKTLLLNQPEMTGRARFPSKNNTPRCWLVRASPMTSSYFPATATAISARKMWKNCPPNPVATFALRKTFDTM